MVPFYMLNMILISYCFIVTLSLIRRTVFEIGLDLETRVRGHSGSLESISVKNRKIFLPRVFCVPVEGVPLDLGTGAGGQKLE